MRVCKGLSQSLQLVFPSRPAHKSLQFAVHLTPQYGDTFLELLRLRVVLDIRRRILEDAVAAGFLSGFSSAQPFEDGADCSGALPASLQNQTKGSSSCDLSSDLRARRQMVASLVAQRVCAAIAEELEKGCFSFIAPSTTAAPVAAQGTDGEPIPINLQQLHVLCAYADPNYGYLWFWCRKGALRSPREVLEKMHEEISNDLLSGGALWTYTSAVACCAFGLPNGSLVAKPSVVARDQLHRACHGSNNSASLTARDFVVGSIGASSCFVHGGFKLTKKERWHQIFSADILCA